MEFALIWRTCENIRALSQVCRLGLLITGGSDGHIITDPGSAVAYPTSADPTEFLDEIRNDKAGIIGPEKHLPQ